MNVTLEPLPQCKVKIHVNVPSDDVKTVRKKIEGAYQRNAKVPGFRPGKAPLQLITSRYQQEIQGELNERLVSQYLQEAAQKEEIVLLSADELNDSEINDDGSFSFTVTGTVSPTVTPPDLTTLELTAPIQEARPELIEKQLDVWASTAGDFVRDENHVIGFGDSAIITYTASLDGAPLKESHPDLPDWLVGESEKWIHLAENDRSIIGLIESIPGHKEGDTYQHTTELPEEFPLDESLAGKTLTYDVTINQARRFEKAALNDDLASRFLGQGATLEQLREAAEKTVAASLHETRNENLWEQASKFLRDNTEFDIPETLLLQETQRNVNDMAMRLARQGVPQEQMQELQGEIFNAAGVRAKENVKLRLILDTIAKNAEISVPENEVIQIAARIMANSGKPPKAAVKELRKNGTFEAIHNDLRLRKAMEKVQSDAKLTETELSVDDYRAAPRVPQNIGHAVLHGHDHQHGHDHEHGEDCGCDHDHEHEAAHEHEHGDDCGCGHDHD